MARIAVLGSAYPLRGGLATYNERLAREFQSEGHETRIYTFSLQYPSILFPGKTQYSDSPPPGDLDIHVTLNSINPASWISTAKKIRDFDPDILVIKYWLPFMGPAFGTIARMVRRKGKTKVISILDNIIPHEHRSGDMSFTRYFVKPVDGFIAMSESVLHDLGHFTESKPALLIPHPLYDNFGEPVPMQEARNRLKLPEGPLLLFFGFIRDYKGLDLLLDALAMLKDHPVKAVVAGEFYTDPDPYLHQIKHLGLEEKVILRTDFIPDEMVRFYFSAADLVVQPYKSATQSGVTQICYHFEKPMVVTNVGGLAEIVPDGKAGYVTEPEAGAIASAIRRFFDQGSASFLPAIRELKKAYSWSRMTEGIFKLAR